MIALGLISLVPQTMTRVAACRPQSPDGPGHCLILCDRIGNQSNDIVDK